MAWAGQALPCPEGRLEDTVQLILAGAFPAHPSVPPAFDLRLMIRACRPKTACTKRRTANSGLTRVEFIWVLVLMVAVTAIILGTLRGDRSNAHMRRVEDHLHYLVGQLRYAVEVDQDRGMNWPAFMLGPGVIPAELPQSGAGKLADVLPENHYVPVDPWGKAYVMIRNQDGSGWTIGSSGPAGELPDLQAWANRASQPQSLVRLLIVPRVRR